MTGMLWLDTSGRLSPVENATAALLYFMQSEKYRNQQPLLVQVNSKELAAETAVNGLQVIPSRMVLPHHAWVVFA